MSYANGAGGKLFGGLRARSDLRKRWHHLEAEIFAQTLGQDVAGASGD